MNSETTLALNILARLSELKVTDFWRKVQDMPVELKQDVTNLLKCYRSGHNVRALVSAQVKPSFSFVFRWFAKDMAIQAVRDNNPDLIFDGLTALAIENSVFDIRDTIVVMAPLYNSALKLGADSSALFQRAAQLARNKRLAEELEGFPKRRPSLRALKAFGFAESGSGESFTYVGLD